MEEMMEPEDKIGKTTILVMAFLALLLVTEGVLLYQLRKKTRQEIRSVAAMAAPGPTSVPGLASEVVGGLACRYCRIGSGGFECKSREGDLCLDDLNECESDLGCRGMVEDGGQDLEEEDRFCNQKSDEDTFRCKGNVLEYCSKSGEEAIGILCKEGCSTLEQKCYQLLTSDEDLGTKYFCGRVELVRYAGVTVHPDAVAKVHPFVQTAALKGHNVVVLDGFRSCEEQSRIYQSCEQSKAVDTQGYQCVVAPAGYSQHSTGRSVDMYLMENGELTSIAPLRDLAIRMGMENPFYPLDPPHFYVR